MTHLWPGGESITVETDSKGLPICFKWKGQPYAVKGIAAEWRMDEQWWGNRKHRQYFKLYTEHLLVEIFQDLVSSQWYIEKQYD